jgi:putative ubiquitin-RnfH superfamily antitoxin RatB of RatAB toxin-antitoxin module
MVNVELIFIAADQTIYQYHLSMHTGANIADAIKASGIIDCYPEIQSFQVGIFSKLTERTTTLMPGDRIEIYRPLTGDPKEKRRTRAAKKRNNK